MVPSHHGLSYQSQGCSRGGGGWGVFPSSFPTWTGPSPPHRMAAGPTAPTAARLPPASWEAPSLPPELPS